MYGSARQHRPLDADDALVVGQLVAADVGDLAVAHADLDAAAGAAVAADRLVPGVGGRRRQQQLQRAPGRSAQTVRRRHAAHNPQQIAAAHAALTLFIHRIHGYLLS